MDLTVKYSLCGRHRWMVDMEGVVVVVGMKRQLDGTRSSECFHCYLSLCLDDQVP